MTIKDYKCKCGHGDFFFADKGNQKGIYCSYCGKWYKWADKDEQNLTLKQEPCNDAISRQAVLDMVEDMTDQFGNKHRVVTEGMISLLPSVNPQPKTGHWIDDNENEIDAQYGRHLYKCSECNEYADMFVGGAEDWWDIEKPNYCPNCGARMESEEV